jgi:hypothetical protein
MFAAREFDFIILLAYRPVYYCPMLLEKNVINMI